MGTVKLCQPSTDSLKPKTAGHVTFCRLSHRGPRSNSSQAWRQSTVISRVITFIHASLSLMWYIPRQYINLQDAYEMCFGHIKHSNMTPGKLLDGPGCLATRPSHVLQTAFRCAKKLLQIISVKISEEVFSFS